MESEKPSFEPFRLFSSSGSGLFDQPEPPLPPPPPCVEVLPSQKSPSGKFTVEPVELGGLTLLKGRVSTQEVFTLSNSDLVPGKYEGGLKLWEGSLDLVKALSSEVQNGHLSFAGKRVLELGCGHGLPGIVACIEGAAAIHFQDFNAEVLQCLTIPNVNANVPSFQPPALQETKCDTGMEIRFFAGDWCEVHNLLPYAQNNEKDVNVSSGQNPDPHYDIILMAETVYSISTLQHLYELIKKCITRPHGVVYLAAKKHYFGVGGGTRRFLSVVEKDGVLVSSMVAEVADGSSNVREVWKLSFK
ncbi:PREDICTED: histidine protein methyltransferase 1 homolog [Fragaria vesca subsp. vesca]|uniref:histidine protein methyltransferase 1 homolog n=1 Tax=Fragaria vesca subsp. vesca TaxID=101020 RepID=UPI0002C32A79|nr:PREDICTED: histidine protein methyltransferase 1 homolog [Fragaria vesca subsp. vesca]